MSDRVWADRTVIVCDPALTSELALKYFKKQVQKTGVFHELRKRERSESRTDRRRRKERQARKRAVRAAARTSS
jgi:small subunit ribosomal protein S21